MPEKLGNGGHGREEYDPNTGKYVADGQPNKVYNNPKEPSYGYHAGDLGKAEQWSKVNSTGRDSGHLGTGTYFISDPQKLGSGYKERPLQMIDFNNYNLYKPSTQEYGIELHNGLRIINKIIDDVSEYLKNKNDIDNLITFFNHMETSQDNFDLLDYEKVSNSFNNLISSGFFDKNNIDVEKIDVNDLSHDLKWDSSLDEELLDYKIDGFDDLFNNLNNKKNQYLNAEKKSNSLKQQIEEKVYTLFQNTDFKTTLSKIETFNKLDDFMYDALEQKHSKAEIRSALNETVNVYDTYGKLNHSDVDSLSTVFMKKLGYEGIDVRHIGTQNNLLNNMDSIKYGSVIYDLKGEDLEKHKRAKQEYEERQKASQLYGINIAK